MKDKINIFLLLILLLGTILRFIGLTKLPMYGDELTMVYDSYSLLKTGKDQLGNPWPITFKMGEGRPAGYVYASIPFVALFGGPTVYAVRSVSVLSGVGIIILMYFFGKKLFNRKVGLLAALFTAISPWNLSLSQGGFEAHFALFLALLAVVLFFYSKSNQKLLVVSATAFGLTLITYPTYKLVLPLFLIILFVSNFKSVKNLAKSSQKIMTGSILIFLFLLSLSVSQTLFNNSEARFFNISLFSDHDLKEKITQEINYERSVNTLPDSLRVFFINKPIKYSQVLLKNYLDNFSFDFLFLSGDGNPRHNMTGVGEFYWIEIILILTGVWSLRGKDKKYLIFLLGWLLLVPMATALISSPHALRNAFMFPPLALFSALGINLIFVNMKSNNYIKLLGTILILVFVFEFILLINNLYFLSPNKYSDFWSSSAKQAIEIINQKIDDYDYIFLSTSIDNAEYAYQVYSKLDPNLVISQQDFPHVIDNIHFKNYGNVYIGTIPTEKIDKLYSNLKDKKILLLTNYNQKDLLNNYQITETSSKLPKIIIINN